MSWLLVAFIPGLLMLATFGLDRIEAGLCENPGPADDVDQLVEQVAIEPAAGRANGRDGVRRPLSPPAAVAAGPLPHRNARPERYAMANSEPYLPTRAAVQRAPNPQFQPTRQADRV